MLKTVRSTRFTVLPTCTTLLLAFLILVMSAHILFDDLSFSLIQQFHPNQSEVTHQDDLAYFSDLIPQIFSKAILQITPVLMIMQVMTLSLNFNPPKI